MNYTEAKEHAEGRLHQIFAMPYEAFNNDVPERNLHLRLALEALLAAPLRQGRLSLQVIYGWENGAFDPADLHHHEHPLCSADDVAGLQARYREAQDMPAAPATLMAEPLEKAIADAERTVAIDDETRRIPARWPAFPRGLSLYTFFKVYHRLTYGEDDAYRSIRCQTADGMREIHEFHLEEGEFAVVTPQQDTEAGEVTLVLHLSQVEPVLALLRSYDIVA
ncbi:hypothetical protein [Onishia taeanensis]